MKRILLAVVFALGLLNTQAQKEKNLVVDANAEVRNVSGFTGIEISGSIDLYLSQGKEDAVAVSATNEEIRGRIRTEIKNNTLNIYLDGKGLNWKRWGNYKVKAYVTFKSLERLEASGASNIEVVDGIKQDALNVELSGASDFNGEVMIGKLKIIATGACNVKISGTADNAIFEASGACGIKAYELKTDLCTVSMVGASNIRITVNKELSAVAKGGSTVFYKGTGLIRDISSTAGSTIQHRAND